MHLILTVFDAADLIAPLRLHSKGLSNRLGFKYDRYTVWVDIFEELKFREYQYQARL